MQLKKLKKIKSMAWDTLRSPRTISYLKLAAAVVGVIHAIEELRSTPSRGKQPIGFQPDEENQES